MTWLAILVALLCYAILTIWVEAGWAWAAFQVGVFTLAAAWLAAAWMIQPRKWTSRSTVVLLPPAAAVLWGLSQIALHRTIYRWATLKSVLTWATWLAVLFLAVQLLADARPHRRFLRVLAGFGAVLSVVATVQMFTSGGRIFWIFPSGYPDFILGPFVNRDQYAAFVELLLPVALAESLRDPKHWLLWCAMAGGMFASVIASASRAGLVIATLETIAVLAVAKWGRRFRLPIAATFATLAVVFTAVVGWQEIWKRLSDPDPYAGRREMLQASVQMIRERPWTGFGLGTWPIAYPRFALYDDGSTVNQAHNDWAQWTVEGGIPFLAILLAMAIPAVRPAIRSLWGIGLLAVMVHAFVDFPFQQRPALGACFFALLGALWGGRPRPCPRR